MRYDEEKILNKMSITLYGTTYSTVGFASDSTAEELMDFFKRLLVSAGFSPCIMSDENGSYYYEQRGDNK